MYIYISIKICIPIISMGIEPMLPEPQSEVLPLNYNIQ